MLKATGYQTRLLLLAVYLMASLNRHTLFTVFLIRVLCIYFSNPIFIGAISGTLTATLKFKVREIDPSTGEPDTDSYDDNYPVCSFYFYRISCFSLKN